ncbi:hypothetical protein ANTRET_LOCUS3987 [Anthophora retusa]
MNGLCKREEKGRGICDKRIKITGKKWEYPIPKSKEHWEKFCEDEEKRLIVVRTPLKELSYRSLSKTNSDFLNFNTPFSDNISDPNSSSNSYVDERKLSESSLHKLFPIRLKSKQDQDRRDVTGLFPKAILKTTVRGGTKIPDTTCNLATSSKVVRIPKLDTLDPQPSSGKILPGKVDHIRAPFSVQNEAKVQGKSSSTLPILGTSSTTLDPQLTLKKLRKYLRLPEKKDLKFKDRSRKDIAKEKGGKSATNEPVIREMKTKNQKITTDEESLKYSVRFAYKALKRITKNKNLDFDPNFIELEDIEKHERNGEYICTGDKQRVSRRKSVEDSKFTRIDVEHATLESEETMSRTILTESRYTSASSLEFVHSQNSRSPSNSILNSIPKLSGYPRKTHDRCLPCMLKSFGTPVEKKTSFPRTTLQRIINSENTEITSLEEESEDSDSSSLSITSFEHEFERIPSFEVETKELPFDEKYNISDNEDVIKAVSSFQENHEQVTSTAEKKCISDSEASCKTITRKIKVDQRDDDLARKNLKDVTISSIKGASLERTRVSSIQGESFKEEQEEEEEDEDDSIAISISGDQSKPKYFVPCHAPTNFRPSLEPLRALRNRKPTTLQDRIALLESSSVKKSISIEDYNDIREKPRSVPKGVDGTERTKVDEKPVPPLTRAKSVLEKLTSGKGTEKQRHVLKKGTSFSCFPVSTGTMFNKSEIYRVASKDALRELDATRDDGFLKTLRSSNFSRATTKLPLTCSNEVLKVFENLEENSSTTSMMEILCKEFSERLTDNIENEKSDEKERREMIIRLTRLLVDSKRYLYPDKFPSDLHFSTNQPPNCNSRLLRRIFPLKTYNLIAPILGMPEFYPKKEAAFDTTFKDATGRRYTDEAELHDSLIVHPPTSRGSETLGDEEKVGHRRYNPYALFLMKPRRKVVTWRPLTKRDLEGYDPNATLEMRADRTMKKICQDFCQWIETLGGTENVIDEEVLRDMFEIDFSAEACKGTQVLIREMPVVPAEVALTRNSPNASKLAMTKKHVMEDLKAENTPAKTKAFGTSIPRKLRFVPPNNQVEKRWLRCENVPRDIETMDVVWKDITHLRSVTGFVEWLQQHPEVPQPEALKKIASMDIRTLRQTEDDDTFAHLELDLHQIKSLRVAVDDD